jgi:hypothetical protein
VCKSYLCKYFDICWIYFFTKNSVIMASHRLVVRLINYLIIFVYYIFGVKRYFKHHKEIKVLRHVSVANCAINYHYHILIGNNVNFAHA